MELQLLAYRQLQYEERVKLAEMKQSQRSIGQMAEALNRSKSTISRELHRNQAPPGHYWPDIAQRLMLSRCERPCLLDTHASLREFVLTHLQCHYWTPEQIAGWLQHRQTELPSVCAETIYAWIYKAQQRKEKLWKFLPRHKAKRGLRKSNLAKVSRIPNRISIHDRPKVVNNKRHFGHWEADLVSFRKNSQHMLVARERKTMFTFASRLPTKRAVDTSDNLISFMSKLPKKARKTITYDNGGEFSAHERVSQAVEMSAFFCDPYASWQKGGVENTNGRLRRDMPRDTDIHTMTQEEFDENILNYNMTPRKSLGWFTPLEAFQKNLSGVALRT
jgi:IS30 family transposase